MNHGTSEWIKTNSFLRSSFFPTPPPFISSLPPSPNPKGSSVAGLRKVRGDWMPGGWVCQEGTLGCQEYRDGRLAAPFGLTQRGLGWVCFFFFFPWKIMGRDCPTVMGERPGHCQDLSIFGCSKRILWRETTCRTPLCNATCRLLLSKQSQTPALPEVMSLSACAPDRSGFGLIFGPHCSKLGAGSQGGGGWGRSADWHPWRQGAHCCFGIIFFF